MFAGIDIGGTKTAVVCGEETRVLSRKVIPTGGVAETLEWICSALCELDDIEAVGVSCGSPLDAKRGIIMSPPNLPGWDDIHITEMLSRRFGIPCALENDANACALAEYRYGSGRGACAILRFVRLRHHRHWEHIRPQS